MIALFNTKKANKAKILFFGDDFTNSIKERAGTQIYILLHGILICSLIANGILYKLGDNLHLNEVYVYIVLLYVTSFISIKAIKFLYFKQCEILNNKKFYSRASLEETMKHNKKYRHSKIAWFSIFIVAAVLPGYVIFYNGTAFSLPINIIAFICLTFTIYLALSAGYFFFILAVLVRHTEHSKVREYNRLLPIATPIFTCFGAGISIGLIYFWSVGILLMIIALSHTYVLNIDVEAHRMMSEVVACYLDEAINLFSASEDTNALYGIWIVFIVIFFTGFALFSIYPYVLLRKKVLNLKVNSIYTFSRSKAVSQFTDQDLKIIKAINDSPNWYSSTVIMSGFSFAITIVLGIKELLTLIK